MVSEADFLAFGSRGRGSCQATQLGMSQGGWLSCFAAQPSTILLGHTGTKAGRTCPDLVLRPLGVGAPSARSRTQPK